MKKESGGRWRSKAGKDRWSQVNMWKNSHKPEFKMLFTGRELLLSSLKEKCFHTNMSKALEITGFEKIMNPKQVETQFI